MNSFEDRTTSALESILEKISTIDRSNAELKAKMEMLEKSISCNLDDLHERVKTNKLDIEKIEDKLESKIKYHVDRHEAKLNILEKDHSDKISKLEQNQNKILGAVIIISPVAAIIIKLL